VSTSDDRHLITRIWWIMLLRGLALLAVGIVFLVRPAVPLTAVILIMGVYWLIDGTLTVIRSVKERGRRQYWGYGLFVGIVSIIAGVVVFSQPMASALLTTALLATFVGIAALIAGVTSLVTGLRMRRDSQGAWYPIVGGAASILFGVLLVASPVSSITFLVKSLGILGLLVGTILVAYALKIRAEARTLPSRLDG
jgi:uncharacterized membrane protein HdeD (DUF308 family)